MDRPDSRIEFGL